MTKLTITYTCQTCSAPFSALSSRTARYCSPACRQKAHRERVKANSAGHSSNYDQLSQVYRAALVKIEVLGSRLTDLAKEHEASALRIRYLEDLTNRISVDRKSQLPGPLQLTRSVDSSVPFSPN
jgi:hypothetical protein